jgi:hypothetical protein
MNKEKPPRSNTKITEIKGSHVVFISQPKAVADVIETAAKSGAGVSSSN